VVDEAIAAAGDGLNVARAVGRIAENIAEFFDGAVQAGFEVHKGAGRPQLLLQLFARDNFTGMLEQELKDSKRLLGKAKPGAVLVQFTRGRV
jgi:hypothetical protein